MRRRNSSSYNIPPVAFGLFVLVRDLRVNLSPGARQASPRPAEASRKTPYTTSLRQNPGDPPQHAGVVSESFPTNLPRPRQRQRRNRKKCVVRQRRLASLAFAPLIQHEAEQDHRCAQPHLDPDMLVIEGAAEQQRGDGGHQRDQGDTRRREMLERVVLFYDTEIIEIYTEIDDRKRGLERQVPRHPAVPRIPR